MDSTAYEGHMSKYILFFFVLFIVTSACTLGLAIWSCIYDLLCHKDM